MKILKIKVKEALSKSGLPDLDYALNPYIGCSHGCIYCYAREYTRYREVATNWGKIVIVKENLVEVLKREIKTHRKGVVGVGTITDAYQYIEKDYELTRRSIEILLEHGFRLSIQTKSPLVIRDLDILIDYRKSVDVGFTITTVDDDIAKHIEPNAPPPRYRVEALYNISSYGIETWIFLGPIIPGINDDSSNIEKIVRIAKDTKSTLFYDKLRVKRFMYTSNILKPIIDRISSYSWQNLYSRIENICRKYDVVCKPGFEYQSVEYRFTLNRFFRC